MSVKNYVVMHVSLENINLSHKKVKGSKQVFSINWKQKVTGVVIKRALKNNYAVKITKKLLRLKWFHF